MWTYTNESRANDNVSVRITIQFGTVSINILCVHTSLFARSLVCRVCFSFGIYHVNIILHRLSHCRISMFQTWSLCYSHAYFQANVNRRRRRRKSTSFSIHRFSMWTEKFAILFRVSVKVKRGTFSFLHCCCYCRRHRHSRTSTPKRPII